MRQSVEAAYTTYADLLYRLALSHLAHPEDAMDAVQDVFLKYASSPPSFRDTEHERAWFIRVTINRCHDLQRRRNIRRHEPLEDHTDTPDKTDRLRPTVLEAVDTLPASLRDAVVLHYLEGFSVEETARILRLSVSAVKMRLSRARESLRSTFEKEGL